mmetsp:Transcript_26517/g.76549  ORF Transcript_26517/g.76549 Transcript_26517/m.76549 type:complete len:234 (-) Transcript_26517:2398-3099(-)
MDGCTLQPTPFATIRICSVRRASTFFGSLIWSRSPRLRAMASASPRRRRMVPTQNSSTTSDPSEIEMPCIKSYVGCTQNPLMLLVRVSSGSPIPADHPRDERRPLMPLASGFFSPMPRKAVPPVPSPLHLHRHLDGSPNHSPRSPNHLHSTSGRRNQRSAGKGARSIDASDRSRWTRSICGDGPIPGNRDRPLITAQMLIHPTMRGNPLAVTMPVFIPRGVNWQRIQPRIGRS